MKKLPKRKSKFRLIAIIVAVMFMIAALLHYCSIILHAIAVMLGGKL